MTCSAITPKLTEVEILERLSRLNGWSRGDDWLQKKYEFKNFLRAMSFVNAVAYLAESVNHHPDILINYNEVTLMIWTHVVGGMTEYDFELAGKVDALIAKE
jgi:4a-hydroxytetrahydrobiopterin dehydratase